MKYGKEMWAYEDWRNMNSIDLNVQEKWGNPERVIVLTPQELTAALEEAYLAGTVSATMRYYEGTSDAYGADFKTWLASKEKEQEK